MWRRAPRIATFPPLGPHPWIRWRCAPSSGRHSTPLTTLLYLLRLRHGCRQASPFSSGRSTFFPLRTKQTTTPKQAPTQASHTQPATQTTETSESMEKAKKQLLKESLRLVRNSPRTFDALGLIPPLLERVKQIGFEKPTEVQRKLIPIALKGLHVVVSAKTGTGKTAAYALPMLQKLHEYFEALQNSEVQPPAYANDPKIVARPRALVLTPTRELAEQVAEHIRQLALSLPRQPRIIQLSGSGGKILSSLNSTDSSLDIVVATPGRLLSMTGGAPKLQSKNASNGKTPKRSRAVADQENEDDNDGDDEATEATIDLSGVRYFVVDECDRIMGLGQLADLKDVLARLPRPAEVVQADTGGPIPQLLSSQPLAVRAKAYGIQTLLVSATLLPELDDLLRRLAPYHVLLQLNPGLSVPKEVRHIVYLVTHRRKLALLLYFLRRRGSPHLRGQRALVFVRTKQRAERITARLVEEGFKAEALHGDRSLAQRRDAVAKFREGELQLLVTTDVMARGIDLPELPFVINFDVPLTPHEYVHRTGRTGRAGQQGTAITFVDRDAEVVDVPGGHGKRALINERKYLNKIREFVGMRLSPSKVPGPWSDGGRENEPPQPPAIGRTEDIQRLEEVVHGKEKARAIQRGAIDGSERKPKRQRWRERRLAKKEEKKLERQKAIQRKLETPVKKGKGKMRIDLRYASKAEQRKIKEQELEKKMRKGKKEPNELPSPIGHKRKR